MDSDHIYLNTNSHRRSWICNKRKCHINKSIIVFFFYLLPGVIEADLGVSLRVAVAHRLPLTGHFHKPPDWRTQTQETREARDHLYTSVPHICPTHLSHAAGRANADNTRPPLARDATSKLTVGSIIGDHDATRSTQTEGKTSSEQWRRQKWRR